ncbi:acyl-CoA dehydrogenase [Paraburkholderia aspalathi]|uniref:Acyl-CoA dehydrogenase n=1 Tax=Paraburkholderia aspalathi TaxID=1324617 RepID=A0A1I7EA78_9BURK|nr:acyl-CoA dehydrogenase [Paraburkholderia aspalathi]SFU20753.1 acyl-CoA dehydrogenase [Paraburkholderia aspalathi]
MNSLILSRRDINFMLYEWLAVESLTKRERFADHSKETFDAALDTYEEVATELFAPHNKKNDQVEPSYDGDVVTVNPEVISAVRAFADAGLLAAVQDYDLGGMQLPNVVERAGMAYSMAANPSTSGYLFLTAANVNLLLEYGGENLIRRFVADLLTGKALGTMCLSEPQAGSSLADITTRAVAQRDGTYRLSGNKMWISGGDHNISENIVHLVLAKVPDETGKLPAGVAGISLFAVPKFVTNSDETQKQRNDVVVAGLNHKMGYRGTTNCLLNFGEGKYKPRGQAGAEGYLVGEVGRGLSYMFHMMNEARIGVGLVAAALGYTGYLHAVDYARTRRQGRPASSKGAPARNGQVPIIDHTDVKRMLLAQKAYAEGGLALALYSARLVDEQQTAPDEPARIRAGRLLDLLTPITKSWPSQWCLEANTLAIQVHGGYGYTRDYNVEQFYRDNRLNQIHEGTHGVQAIDFLGRKFPMQGGALVQTFALEVAATVNAALSISDLKNYAESLQTVMARVFYTGARLQEDSDRERQLANASSFMEAFGHVVVSWIWLQQAMVAERALKGAVDDSGANFYRGKLQACKYFFEWELPKISSMLAVFEPLSVACLEMQDGWY